MKNTTKMIALILALTLLFALAGCVHHAQLRPDIQKNDYPADVIVQDNGYNIFNFRHEHIVPGNHKDCFYVATDGTTATVKYFTDETETDPFDAELVLLANPDESVGLTVTTDRPTILEFDGMTNGGYFLRIATPPRDSHSRILLAGQHPLGSRRDEQPVPCPLS